MGMDKPAFPESLPSKPTSYFQAARPAPAYFASSTANGVKPSSNGGVLAIVIAFLVLATLGNIGLTIYLSQSHAAATMSDTSAREAKLIDEVAHLRDEVGRMNTKVATATSELGRLKVGYATVVSQVATTTAVRPSPYAVSTPAPSAAPLAEEAKVDAGQTGGKTK